MEEKGHSVVLWNISYLSIGEVETPTRGVNWILKTHDLILKKYTPSPYF